VLAIWLPQLGHFAPPVGAAAGAAPGAAAGAVVYPDSDMIWMWTDDDAVDIIVDRSSALDAAAPWETGKSEAETG